MAQILLLLFLVQNVFQQSLSDFSIWIRSCPLCDFSVPPIHWLCSHCWKKLRHFYLSPRDMVRMQDGLPHFRLFDWYSENDSLIRKFLNSLKKGTPSSVFKVLSSDFMHHIISFYPVNLDSVIIPAPPKLPHLQDHAFCFAHSIAQLTGLKMYTPLDRSMDFPSEQWQRRKNKRDRRKLNFHLQPDFYFLTQKRIIFVDDVLTTGATAFGVYRALKKPKQFLIFSLAWRHTFEFNAFIDI